MLSENLSDIFAWAEVIVITNKEEEFSMLGDISEQKIIDLAHIDSLIGNESYEGLCW